jgi:hypothetical protein
MTIFHRMMFIAVCFGAFSTANASLLTFTASLTPDLTVPPSGCVFNGVPCSGTALLTIDTTTLAISLSMQYTVGAARNIHLNDGAPGTNGLTQIFLRGDLATPCGTGTFCRDIAMTDGFSLPVSNLSDLIAGNDYILVTQLSSDPDSPGLIRGQLQAVPEPKSDLMIIISSALILLIRNKLRSRQ